MNSSLFSLPIAAADSADAAVRDEGQQAESFFFAGPENALLRSLHHAAGEEFAVYNPVVLYGPSGAGKSTIAHNLAAIRRQCFRLENVTVTNANELAQALGHAVDTSSVTEFRTRYQRCDLLLIDDLHRLKGKPAAQQFLLTALDALVHRGSWVLVTMRQTPEVTPGLAPQLASRLMGGLVVPVAMPGPQARREVVRLEAERIGVRLSDEQINQIAKCGVGSDGHFLSASRLRQTVLALAAEEEFCLGKPDAGRAPSNEKPEMKAVCRRVTAVVAKHFGLTTGDLKSKSRRQSLADARGLAMFVTRRLTGASYAEIGREFGNRDHTTVLHACRKLTKAGSRDAYVRRLAEDLAAQVASEGVT